MKKSTKSDTVEMFIECLVPVTMCNLKCAYCYVVQHGDDKQLMAKLEHPPEIIRKALSKERLGCAAFISICGAGETLLQKEIPDIVCGLLEEGHFVNLTTNGTYGYGFDRIIAGATSGLLSHLHFSFSFHYLELLRVGRLESFFDNVKKVKKAGCSFIVQVNLCDDYIPHIETIKQVVKSNVGAYPQLVATRNETRFSNRWCLFTNLSDAAYLSAGRQFDSPLFEFTMKNFMVKRREFCYAGKWSYVLNLSTGDLKSCYDSFSTQNIFCDLKSPIKVDVIGNNCPSPYCVNSSHFLSLGTIADLDCPSYVDLRNRLCADGSQWFSDEMRQFLSAHLQSSNGLLSRHAMRVLNAKYRFKRILFSATQGVRRSESLRRSQIYRLAKWCLKRLRGGANPK